MYYNAIRIIVKYSFEKVQQFCHNYLNKPIKEEFFEILRLKIGEEHFQSLLNSFAPNNQLFNSNDEIKALIWTQPKDMFIHCCIIIQHFQIHQKYIKRPF